MVAVPTLISASGALESEHLESALTTILQGINERISPLIVVIRSTVPPGIIREISRNCLGENNQKNFSCDES